MVAGYGGDSMAYPHYVPTRYSGTEWTVLECQARDASSDTIGKKLNIPRMVLREDALVRMHELWHVKRTKSVSYDTVHAPGMRGVFRRMVEEVALEQDAAAFGIPLYQARDAFDWINAQLPTLRHDLAAMYLQLAGSVPHSKSADLKTYHYAVVNRIRQESMTDLLLLEECLKSVIADTGQQNCEKWADVLTAKFAPPMADPGKPQEKRSAREKREEAEAEEAEEAEQDKAAKRKMDASSQTQESADFDTSELTDEEGNTLTDSNGNALRPLDVHKHTNMGGTSRMVASQWRNTLAGGYVRYPERLVPSGRIFGVRQKGGGILMDWSGSMDWEPEKLEKLIRDLPGTWAAGYDGHTSRKYCGRMCVIAHAGRVGTRVPEAEYSGGNYGTGVDVAAIEYAARYAPRPLVIVTDGACGREWAPQFNASLKRHRLCFVRTIDDAINFLHGRAVYGYRSTSGGSVNTPELVRKGM
jgi:hypothetical protein